MRRVRFLLETVEETMFSETRPFGYLFRGL